MDYQSRTSYGKQPIYHGNEYQDHINYHYTQQNSKNKNFKFQNSSQHCSPNQPSNHSSCCSQHQPSASQHDVPLYPRQGQDQWNYQCSHSQKGNPASEISIQKLGTLQRESMILIVEMLRSIISQTTNSDVLILKETLGDIRNSIDAVKMGLDELKKQISSSSSSEIPLFEATSQKMQESVGSTVKNAFDRILEILKTDQDARNQEFDSWRLKQLEFQSDITNNISQQQSSIQSKLMAIESNINERNQQEGRMLAGEDVVNKIELIISMAQQYVEQRFAPTNSPNNSNNGSQSGNNSGRPSDIVRHDRTDIPPSQPPTNMDTSLTFDDSQSSITHLSDSTSISSSASSSASSSHRNSVPNNLGSPLPTNQASSSGTYRNGYHSLFPNRSASSNDITPFNKHFQAWSEEFFQLISSRATIHTSPSSSQYIPTQELVIKRNDSMDVDAFQGNRSAGVAIANMNARSTFTDTSNNSKQTETTIEAGRNKSNTSSWLGESDVVDLFTESLNGNSQPSGSASFKDVIDPGEPEGIAFDGDLDQSSHPQRRSKRLAEITRLPMHFPMPNRYKRHRRSSISR